MNCSAHHGEGVKAKQRAQMLELDAELIQLGMATALAGVAHAWSCKWGR